MTEEILITYVTRSGSTAEVARAIGKVFSDHNVPVEVCPLKEVRSLDGYRAVVLGSAIRMGQYLPEAVKFIEQNREKLNQKPTAFFAVHLMNLGSDETSRKARQAYLDPVRKLVSPTREAFFAGVGDWKKVSLIDGLIGKMVKAPSGDFRNWQEIHGWAEELLTTGINGTQE